jgi:two-component system OmpR family response regulator
MTSGPSPKKIGASRWVLITALDTATASRLSKLLQQEGYRVRTAASWTSAARVARATPLSGLIVGATLANAGLVELIRAIRAERQAHRIPLLVLADRDARGLELRCLRSGADDFLIKGVHDLSGIPIRLARLHSRPGADELALEIGPLHIDERSRRIWINGSTGADLSRREFDLLLYIVRKSPAVATWADIQRDVWMVPEHALSLGQSPTIAVHCERIRAKLGAAAACLVVRRGLGIQFEAGR